MNVRAWVAVALFSTLSVGGPGMPSPAAAGTVGPASGDSLRTRIQELRCAAEYGPALEAARALRDLTDRDASAAPWQRADAERTVGMLESVLRSPASDRLDLAEADALTAEIADRLRGGDYAGAADLARRQEAVRERLLGPDDPETAGSLYDLARALLEQAKYGEAEGTLRRVLEIRRSRLGEEHPRTADALNNLGTALWKQGRYAEAEALWREALERRRRLFGEEHEDIAASMGNLADLYMSRGDLTRAEPLYRGALVMSRRILGNEDLRTVTLLKNLAILIAKQGNYAEAEPLFREILDLRREELGDQHPEVARSMGALATILGAKGDLDEAETLYRDALEMRRNLFGAEHLEIAQNLIALAVLLQKKGDLAEAESQCGEALAMMRRFLGEGNPRLIPGMYLQGDILLEEGRLAESETALRETLVACRRLSEGGEHPQTGGTLRKLGECLLAQGRFADAESLLSDAADVFEASRLRAGTGFARATFQDSPYHTLAAARLESGDTDGAWPAAERALGRALGDLLMDSGGLAEGRSFTLAEVQKSLDPKTAMVGWLWVKVAGKPFSSWAYVIRDSGPVSWTRLDPDLRAGGHSPDEATENLRESLSVVGSWPFRVTDTVKIDRETADLWTQWLSPIEPQLARVENLVIIPSGPMLGIPVEALQTSDGTCVGERYTVTYAPSATIYAWLRDLGNRKPLGPDGRTLLVGDPPFTLEQDEEMRAPEGRATSSGNTVVASGKPAAGKRRPPGERAVEGEVRTALPRLAWTRREVEQVARVVPGATILLGPEATEQELIRMARCGTLAEFHTIHLATHALVDNECPQRSALVFSQVDLPDPVETTVAGGRIYDGLLTGEEIVHEFHLDADLVTLSACQTALGRETAGEGYIGLAYAFLQAGARSLLVSLWRVEDEATALLMGRFYENLSGTCGDERAGGARQPLPKAEALREAKRWLRDYTDESGQQPFHHPAYWSGFVLIGDPR